MSDINDYQEELNFVLFSLLPEDVHCSTQVQEKMLAAWSKRCPEDVQRKVFKKAHQNIIEHFHVLAPLAQNWILNRIENGVIDISTDELLDHIIGDSLSLQLRFAQSKTFKNAQEKEYFANEMEMQLLRTLTNDEIFNLSQVLKNLDVHNELKITRSDVANGLDPIQFDQLLKHDASLFSPADIFIRIIGGYYSLRDLHNQAYFVDAARNFVHSSEPISETEKEDIMRALSQMLRHPSKQFEKIVDLFLSDDTKKDLLLSSGLIRYTTFYPEDVEVVLKNISCFIKKSNSDSTQLKHMMHVFVKNMFAAWFHHDMQTVFEWMKKEPNVSAVISDPDFYSENVFVREMAGQRNFRGQKRNKISIANTKSIKDLNVSPFVVDVARTINDPKILKSSQKLVLPQLDETTRKNWLEGGHEDVLQLWDSRCVKRMIGSEMPKKRTTTTKRKM